MLAQPSLNPYSFNYCSISDLANLQSVGIQSLEEVFRDMCRRDSKPIEPLGYIMKNAAFPQLPVQKIQQLATIHTKLNRYAGQESPSTKVYAQERGQYLTLSMNNLAQASLSTARKLPGQDSNAIYKQGSNGIGSYARGLQGLYNAEHENIINIFSREDQSSVLNTTCRSSLDVFANTLRDLDAHIKANLITDCYLAYEIIEIISDISINLQDPELKHAFSDALKPVRETAKSSLSTLLTDARSKIQSISALPLDGSGVPITAEVMQRLQTMILYLPALSSIMRSLGDGGWSVQNNAPSNAFDVGADGQQLFAHYSHDTIENLLSNVSEISLPLVRSKTNPLNFFAARDSRQVTATRQKSARCIPCQHCCASRTYDTNI
jgi:exocyst complex component 7